MIKEASGPINFTVFLTMFGEKLKGEPHCYRQFYTTPPEGAHTYLVLNQIKKDPVRYLFGIFSELYPLPSLGADPEDVILSAFKVLDPEGTGTIKKQL